MRNLFFLLLVAFLCANTFGGSVTIKKPGAALTSIRAGDLNAEDFDESPYEDGLVVRSNHDIEYDFYLPNVVMQNLTVRVYGYVEFNLYFESPRDIKIGGVQKLLLEEKQENIFSFEPQAINMPVTDDGLCRKLTVEILPQNWTTYHLRYVTVEYTVENVNSEWLIAFQEASSAYRCLTHYKNNVVDTDLWNPTAAWDSLPLFFVEAYVETVSLGLDVSEDLNPGLLTSLGNVYAFAEYFFGFIDDALWKMDQATFWQAFETSPWGYHGPNLRSGNPSRIAEAVDATKELSALWYTTITQKKLANGLSNEIDNNKTKLQSLRDQMKTAWTDMFRLYSNADGPGGYPENYSEFMITSLAPLLNVCDSETQKLYTSLPDNNYLDNLIQTISKHEILFVTAKVSTYPSEANLRIEVDGDEYTQTATFSWLPGSSHILKSISPQGEYVFDYWSDGSLPQHEVKPATDMEYVAFFSHIKGIPFGAEADVTVWSEDPTNAYRNDWMWVQGNDDGYSQALLYFNLTSIPIYAVVQSAELKLHCQSYHGNENLLALSRIMRFWEEDEVTWRTRPSHADDDIAIDDFGDIPLYSWKSETYPKLKEVVQTWVRGPGINWGFKLRGVGDGVWFYSSEAAEASRIPVLVVNYTASAAGSLNVNIEPREICVWAKWRLTTGPQTNWQKSGATIPAVPVGNYMLEFSNVEGWTCPVARTIIIEEGANFELGTYIRKITPPVVTTLTARDITLDSAELRGRLDDDGGVSCECGFMYGKTSDWFNTLTYASCGTFTTNDSFYAFVDGLERGTEYAYYAMAENNEDTSIGGTEIFTTTPNQAPVLSPIGNKFVEEEQLLTFTVSATDPDGDPITYVAFDLPSGATFVDQTFTWTPSSGQAGSYSVTFVADDGQDSDYEIITITVSTEDAVYFADPNLKAAVEETLGMTDPNSTDMLELTELVNTSFKEITSLTGLEYATNLSMLELGHNHIDDISPLSGLINLSMLGLGFNQIDDILPLAGMTNLVWLNLPYNQISDISVLSYLTNIGELRLTANQIDDISALSELTNLGLLRLDMNFITDISALSELEHLNSLNMQSNPLNCDAYSIYIPQIRENNPGITLLYDPLSPVDFTDTNLKAAVEEELGITDPNVCDMLLLIQLGAGGGVVDLTGLEYATNLTHLGIDPGAIHDISVLSGLVNLEYVEIWFNLINDISALTGLSALYGISMVGNQVSVLPDLSGLTELVSLNLEDNQVTSISGLSGVTSFEELLLNNNQISDISPLSGLTNLMILDLASNQVSVIPDLSGLTELVHLNLADNQVTSISGLSGVPNLLYLTLGGNQINDISALSDLSNLTLLNLEDNQISDISPLSELTNLTDLNLRYNPLNQDAYDIYIPQIISNNPGINISYDPEP